MKDQIQLSELQNYLAYGLKVKCNAGIITMRYVTNSVLSERLYSPKHPLSTCKPLVRPLSELTEEITINGEKFIPINELKMKYGWDYLFYDIYKIKKDFNVNELKYASLKQLFLWNFDVFNWIGRGMALSLTDFEKEKVL